MNLLICWVSEGSISNESLEMEQKFSHNKFKRLEVIIIMVADWKTYRNAGRLSLSGYLILWNINEFFCPMTVLSKPIQLNYNFPCRIQTWFILDNTS